MTPALALDTSQVARTLDAPGAAATGITYSPMLLPTDRATLGIQTVTCRQNDATGTTSTLTLVLKDRLGGRDPIDTSKGDGSKGDGDNKGPSSPEDSIPYAPDDI